MGDLAERLRRAGVAFVIEPSIRFKAEVGEHATMFFRDPAGNALEFKAFADIGQLFAKIIATQATFAGIDFTNQKSDLCPR
jgi:extradiol dioxygenase family protein